MPTPYCAWTVLLPRPSSFQYLQVAVDQDTKRASCCSRFSRPRAFFFCIVATVNMLIVLPLLEEICRHPNIQQQKHDLVLLGTSSRVLASTASLSLSHSHTHTHTHTHTHRESECMTVVDLPAKVKTRAITICLNLFPAMWKGLQLTELNQNQ